MGRPIGAVARLSSIVTVSITAILALVIVLGWTSAVVTGSAAARPECAPAPLAASIMEAQRGGFPPVVRAVSAAGSAAEVSVEAAGASADRRRLFDRTSGVLKNFVNALYSSLLLFETTNRVLQLVETKLLESLITQRSLVQIQLPQPNKSITYDN